MTKAEATAAGRKLRKALNGKGWKIEVWENLGWHYAAHNVNVSVHPSASGKTYHARVGVNGGGIVWNYATYGEQHFSSENPNEAVIHELLRGQSHVNALSEILRVARLNLFKG